MLPSFDKVISNPTIKDVGYKAHIDLVAYLERNELGYAIIDATLLLKSPERVLKQLCELIGILFDQSMMRWPLGPCSQDGVWAKHWYKNVHEKRKKVEKKIIEKIIYFSINVQYV